MHKYANLMKPYCRLASPLVAASGAVLGSLETVNTFTQGQTSFSLLVTTAGTGLSLLDLFRYFSRKNLF